MPKTANVFAVTVNAETERHVLGAIVSVVAKSPTAALTAALSLFKDKAKESGKSLDVDRYTVTSHGMSTYTVQVSVNPYP